MFSKENIMNQLSEPLMGMMALIALIWRRKDRKKKETVQ
jgi:hypothetical protein